jgi:citrate lyase beta subunit
MTMRTRKWTVTFTRPFRLGELGDEFPAGDYSIETDEELVDGVSFPVYRRTATMMQLIADPLRPGVTETAVIDPRQLEAALEADAAQAPKAEQETASALLDASQDVGRPAAEGAGAVR